VFEKDNLRAAQIPQLQALHGYNLDGYKLPNKRQVLRNCVSPVLGLHILNAALGKTPEGEQMPLFTTHGS
jgi:DNA (cytosine-5)-methyltransferase 1